MRLLSLNKGNLEELLKDVTEILRGGGVVMHPTDTCFGLAADITNQNALEKLYAIKQMDKSKPVSIMVSSIDMALEFGDFSKLAIDCAENFWPGPLTVIVKRSALLPDFLNEEVESVGIRCPGHEFSLSALKAFGKPLTTTSANISGEGEVQSVEQYIERMQKEIHTPDVIVYDENYKVGKPSSIVDFAVEPPFIVRRGLLSSQLEKLF